MSFKAKIKGLDKLQKIIDKAPDNIIKEVDAIMQDGGNVFVRGAVRDAPKDVGFLAGEIFVQKEADLKYLIQSNSEYAGYLEFGTKTKFQNIPGFEEVAASLKGGGGGTFKDLLRNIEAWCHRHGIDQKAVYPIALEISRNGIKPQPYFFKQYPTMQNQIEKDLNTIEKVLEG